MILDKKQVMSFLPHRDPFLFIDGLKEIILPGSLHGKNPPFQYQELIGGKTICSFRVLDSLKVLEGHFPGHPILPGVVQVEMMAQASAFLLIYGLKKSLEESILDLQLVGVDSSRFRRPVVPPMDLEIHSVLKKTRGNILVYDCEIHSSGELVSQSTIMASIKINYR
jgi:3-hydroxyacyl-[acyl-carrier-protein] dehydratase